MVVGLLSQNEDGSQAYSVVLDKQEVAELQLVKEENGEGSLADTLKGAIEVGMGY